MPSITNPEAIPTIEKFMDNLIQNHNMEMNEYLFMELFKYQESYFENNDLIPFFLNQTIVINIPEYGLTLYEILGPNKYKPVFSELKQSYPDRKINKNFIVQKMYYHKQLPIAFSAKLNDTDIEKWFWSDQFELALRFIEPETLTIPKCALTIDAILDKINEYGIECLSDEELNFLQLNK